MKVDVETELTLSDLYLQASRHEDAELANNRVLKVDPNNPYAMSRSTYFSYAAGDHVDAERSSLELIKGKKKRDHQVALDYHNLAALLIDLGRPGEALTYVQNAYDAVEDGDTSATTSAIKLVEAAATHNQGLVTRDASLYLKSLRLFFRSHNNLEKSGMEIVLFCRSKCEIARFYIEQFTQENLNRPPAAPFNQRTISHVKHGVLQNAEEYLKESIEVGKTFKAYNYIHLKEPFKLLLKIYGYQDRVAEYLELIKNCESSFRTKNGATELALEQGLKMFADLYMEVDRFDLAKPLYVEAIELLQASKISDQHYYCNSLSNLGSLYRRFDDDLESAERYIRLALAIRQLHQGPLHSATAQTMKNLAFALRLKGKQHYEEARRLYLEALNILILEKGYDDPQVAKWIGDFSMLNLDEGAYWLARLKLKYAYDTYMRLGCIQMFTPPFGMHPQVPPGYPEHLVPEPITFPTFPYGATHNELTHKLETVDRCEEWVMNRIKLLKTCTAYNNQEIAEMMEVQPWMVETRLELPEAVTKN